MLLRIEDLRVRFRLGRENGPGPRWTDAVGRDAQGVSLDVGARETVALVGESGSGKSVTALSILNLLPDNAERRGRILFEGEDLLQASDARLLQLRGRDIACVFQDPMSALNPVLTLGDQLTEPLIGHLGLSRKAAWARAEALLEEVGLPEPSRRLRAYAHELSGGQQQRVMIAMALACQPRLLIADEPTTALDVTVQRQILDLLRDLQRRHDTALLFITHDLGVVGEIADRVVVMRHGTVRETGTAQAIFTAPHNDYTRALLACRPSANPQAHRLPTLDDAHRVRHTSPAAPTRPISARTSPRDGARALIDARDLSKAYVSRGPGWRRHTFQALHPTQLTLSKGETVGIVGESGSGKSTLGLTLMGLIPASGGSVRFDGEDLLNARGAARQILRRRLQIVFQNPYASLNPRFTIGQTLLEPLRIHRLGESERNREHQAQALLERVGLNSEAWTKYPHEFSGGQRQRIAIARALTLSPEVLILDEAVSALDVSVQAQVLNLLKDLQEERGLAYLFITHDLSVVRFMADRILVMKAGRVVEEGPTEAVMNAPTRGYTRRLLQAVPRGWTPRPGGPETPDPVLPPTDD